MHVAPRRARRKGNPLAKIVPALGPARPGALGPAWPGAARAPDRLAQLVGVLGPASRRHFLRRKMLEKCAPDFSHFRRAENRKIISVSRWQHGAPSNYRVKCLILFTFVQGALGGTIFCMYRENAIICNSVSYVSVDLLVVMSCYSHRSRNKPTKRAPSAPAAPKRTRSQRFAGGICCPLPRKCLIS